LSAAPAPAAQRKPPRARWVGALKVVFALALLALVFTIVPWTDTLVLERDGVRASAQGTIEGTWQSSAVRFRPDAWDALGPFADELAARREADGALAVDRTAADQNPALHALRIDWRPGMPRVFREMDPRGLALALVCFTLGQLIVSTRWWRLLRAVGCPTTWWSALRLNGLGLFFNIVVPGLTGGDLVKAVLAAREHKDRGAGALVSVAVDRVLGLLSMALLAAVVILLSGEVFAAIRMPVLLFVAAGILGAVLVSSRALRRLLRFDRLLERLPFGKKLKELDEAVLLYSKHPGEIALALALSYANHAVSIFGVLALGRAFGDHVLSWERYLAITPVATIVSALPVAPGGWGVGEAAYAYLFQLLGASAAIGLACSVTFRLIQTVLGLCGGVFLVLPGERIRLAEMKRLGETA
jgi:uncharacterized protein (TIRG00374 family)